MPVKQPVKYKLYEIILSNYTVLTVLLAVTSLLLGLGFAATTGDTDNYDLIHQLAPFSYWATFCTLYGVTKLGGLFFEQLSRTKITVSLLGLWLWSYVALSFIWFDRTPVAPTELMLLVTVFAEVWTLTVLLYNKGLNNGTD